MFGTSGLALGLCTSYEEHNGSGTALLHKDYAWTQDPAGNVYTGAVTATLDPGMTWQAQTKTVEVRDSYGNTTSSQVFDYGNLSTPARTQTYTYLADPNYLAHYIRNRVIQATVNGITITTNTYDGTSLTSRSGLAVHDSAYSISNLMRGNLTHSVTPGAIRNTGYDIGGLAVTTDDGYGHSITVNASTATNYSLPDSILPTASTNKTTSFTYSGGWMPASVAGPNGDTDSKTYDSIGRVATSTTANGALTTYSYDYTHHTVTGATVSSLPYTPLAPRFDRTTYDGFGRTIKQESGDNGNGAANTVLSTVDTQYAPCACSPLGKISQVSMPYGPGETEVWTKYQYDASGRTVQVTGPDGVSVTTYAYQGNQTTVTDPAGKWKQYTTDAMGNLIQVIEPNPNGGANFVTSYTYDALNHLIQVTMTRQGTTQTRSFTYDSTTQRLISVQTPETGITTYAYNSDGTLQNKTDAKGQQTKYQYDAFQRVIETDYVPTGSGQPDPCQTVQYQYDSATVLQQGQNRNGYGRLTGVHWSSPNCQYQLAEEYAYGGTHLVFLKKLTVTNTGSNVPDVVMAGSFSYDAEGRLYFFQPPYDAATGWHIYTWDRDALARPVDMYSGSTQSPTPLVGGVSYTGSGRMLTMNVLSHLAARTTPKPVSTTPTANSHARRQAARKASTSPTTTRRPTTVASRRSRTT
jgi:YD repeat-containing protein